jgi:hypothetical protein
MLHTVPHFCRKKSRRTDRERGRSPFLRWRPIEARAARPHPASAKSYKPPRIIPPQFSFCSQNPSPLSVPLQPRTAPYREFAAGRATTPRHAAQPTSTARKRANPAKAQSRRRRPLRPPAPDFFSCLPPWIGVARDFRAEAAVVVRRE